MMSVRKKNNRSKAQSGKNLSIPTIGVLVLAVALSGVWPLAISTAQVNQKKIKSLLNAGDTTQAIEELYLAVSADSEDYLALFWQGRIAYARKNYSEALQLFEKSLGVKKKAYISLYYLSLTQIHLAMFDEAKENIKKGNKRAKTLRIEFKGAEDTLKAWKLAFEKSGRIPGMDNGSTGSETNGSSPQYTEEFVRRLKTRIRKNPGDPINYYGIGRYHFEKKEFAEAQNWFEQALDQDKDHEQTHYWRGKTYLAIGDLGEAEDVFDKWLKKTENFTAEFSNGLGMVRLEEARIESKSSEEKASKRTEKVFELASEADELFRVAI
ncbi:MAG: tetratricopeptide repeat protein, partial [candidate division Zixibacteria bacterium]|nr:tetratricopeptide repeat protein [candidate division Zixibacteria bacterium]